MHTIHPCAPGALPGDSAVALGYFDGVHIGHRAVLRAAVDAASRGGLTPAAFTFTLAHGGAGKGKAILTAREKLRRMEACGIETALCPPFEEFCMLSPEQFVDEVLVRALRAKQVFSGDDFTFGTHKSGNAALLRELCARRGVAAHIVPTCIEQGAPVSSTRIRRHLEAGEMERANELLGEAYAVTLPVRRGRGLGHTLGFPTINQTFPEEMTVPRLGVYVSETFLGGAWRPSVTGLGARPTVSDAGDVTCETFIPDFSGDVYGDTVQVRLRHYLWETKKYPSLDALADMVRRAAAEAARYFAGAGAQG